MPNLIAIYGPSDEPRIDDQLERLSRATAAARQRDVGYLEVRRQPQAAIFRDLAGLDEHTFAVLLICGSDEVARWDQVVEPDEIWRDGKEGVAGSSPAEGFIGTPRYSRVCATSARPAAGAAVSTERPRTSTDASLSASSSRIACSRPSCARWP